MDMLLYSVAEIKIEYKDHILEELNEKFNLRVEINGLMFNYIQQLYLRNLDYILN
jgi:hypothetical protein